MESPSAVSPSANNPLIVVAADAEDLAEQAARLFVQKAHEAIAERGRFLVALSGGSTPEKMYRHLTEPAYQKSVDWSHIYVFLGDERFVPPEDERSNYGMAERTLLRHVPIDPNHVFPVDTSLPTADDAARVYEATLRTVLGKEPVFDLILLGLGDDGHTASLFPGMPSLTDTVAWVVASPPGVLPPPVERVTFTFPVLNAARNAVFLIAGEKKAEMVRALVEDAPNLQSRPASGVQPTKGTLTYLLDTTAASLLKK